jgi:hypothetical protein
MREGDHGHVLFDQWNEVELRSWRFGDCKLVSEIGDPEVILDELLSCRGKGQTYFGRIARDITFESSSEVKLR